VCMWGMCVTHDKKSELWFLLGFVQIPLCTCVCTLTKTARLFLFWFFKKNHVRQWIRLMQIKFWWRSTTEWTSWFCVYQCLIDKKYGLLVLYCFYLVWNVCVYFTWGPM
jgi:hypothetical protein